MVKYVMKRSDLTYSDLVYWCHSERGGYSIWYDWDGPEYRECENRHVCESYIVFCCIKDGLFHYVE